MNYLRNEEKKFKSYLKKKVSFDLQTLVKFLITGVVAVSVTACGGGGGGGGSSTSTPSNPIDKNIGNKTESITTENKTYINEGSIEVKNSKGESTYALAGKNSKIVNENKISITEGDKNTLGKVIGKVSGIDELNNLLKQGYNVGVFAQGGNVINGEKGQIDITTKKGVGIYLSKATLENNGNININGNFQVNEQGIIGSENIGVWANNGSKAINNGKITLNTTINDTIYKGEYPIKLPYSIGMLAENGSNIENKNLIEGTGNLIGMSVTSNSTGINNGDINLSSGKINSDVTFEVGEYYKYNYDKFFYTDVIGMKADGQGSKVTNNKNIKITGQGTGMVANNGATGINNGNITMTSGEIHKKGYSKSGPGNEYNDYELIKSWAEVVGMSADNGNIENGLNGIITIDGNGKGMYGVNNSNLVNNGTIMVNGKLEYETDSFTDGKEIPTDYKWPFGIPVSGMEIVNGGKAENNGQIIIDTEYYQKEFLNGDREKGYLVLDDYSAGIRVNNSTGINGENGVIEVKGSTAGMLGQNGAKLENNGSIILAQGTSITKEGKEYFETAGMVGNNSEIINNGNIISKDGVITDRVIGIYSEKGKVQNLGNINIKGDFVIGIEGIESNITNDNNIILNGKYVSGILAENGEVINNKLISIESQNPTSSEGLPRSYSSAIEVENGKITNNGAVIGKGNNIVGLDGYNSEILNENKIELTGSELTGIYVHQGGSGVNNGDITINVTQDSSIGSEGILLEGAGKVENTGTITINGNKMIDSSKAEPIEQLISKVSSGIKIIGNQNKENMIVNNTTGTINVSGSAVGIVAQNSNVENKGTINLESGSFKDEEIPPIGMVIYNGNGINNGKILGGSLTSSGMNMVGEGTITNGKDGLIDLSGSNVEGMSTTKNGKAINYGEIKVEGEEAVAMEIDNNYNNPSKEGHSYGENYGTITVIGKNTASDENKNNAIGMRADTNSTVTNKTGGIITVIGENAVGMKADEGGEAINEAGATIKVGSGAYGMVADGGKATNKGTIEVGVGASGAMLATNGGYILNDTTGVINIDNSHGLTEENKEEFALKTETGGTFDNKGTINTNGKVKIDLGSTYTVGTNSDGTFGKLTASDVELNGNLIISTDMVAGSYENSYKLDNIIEGDNINLGEEYKNLSDSLLYDVNTSKDEDGNLDGELVRNDNSISDFTNSNFSQVGKMFDKYLTKENYEKLSQAEKDLVDKIFASTGSADEIKEAIEKSSGKEYLNISRQIFDIKDSFRKYDSSVISTLDKYNHNFTLIGEYGDIQSKDGIVGYDSKMTGFNGAMRLVDNLYGTLGYGYSDIDYDNNSEGKIQTIHAGLYKDYTYNKADIRVGVFGEYNFHETDRDDLTEHKYMNTKYDSYLVGVTGEISKKYGDSLYIQPKLSLDIAYANVESFDEENVLEIKEQDYTSVLPKAEVKVGKKFNNLELFTKSSYSYELGDLDKDMDIKLIEDVAIENDTMDRGNFDISVGTEVKFESLSLSAELGKEFGKRDREYVRAGITYKF